MTDRALLYTENDAQEDFKMDEDDAKVLEAMKVQPVSFKAATSLNKNASVMKEDPEAAKKFEVANKKLKEEDEALRQTMDGIYNEKKQASTFRTKLEKYNHPKCNVYMGTIFALLAGLVAPLFGFAIMKNLSEIMFAQASGNDIIEAIGLWILFMVGLSIGIMICKAGAVILFAKVGQNIIAGVRQELYESVLRKEVGWHDDRENSSGIITATLASDVQTLNGASSEGSAAMIEATAAFLWGIVLAFIFSWPMALVGLGAGPIMAISSFVQQKVDNEMYFQGAVDKELEDGKGDGKHNEIKQADLLVSDAIMNYKTVASFGNDYIIIDEFNKL